MNIDSSSAARLNARLGFVAALTLALLFVLYIFCFVGILLSGPLFIWKDMQGFLDYSTTYDQTLKYLSYAGMLIFCFAWAVLAESVKRSAEEGRKPFAQLGAVFGMMFATVSGANYFVQLTCVRLNLLAGTPGGLEQAVMGNPLSAMESVNMFGWTLLLGLSCLFMGLSFEGRGQRAARVCLLGTAAVCLTGGLAFILNIQAVLAVCMYPLLGFGIISSSMALARGFRYR